MIKGSGLHERLKEERQEPKVNKPNEQDCCALQTSEPAMSQVHGRRGQGARNASNP